MIKNGRPFSVDRSGNVDDALITERKPEEQKKVLQWIKENIYPRKTPHLLHTSYSLKHLLERDTGIYLTNNEFKDAMMICGFEPANPDKLNWMFGISHKSPIFKRANN